jgi:hypothetical protein
MAFGDNDSIRRGLLDLANACSGDSEAQGLPSGTLSIAFYDDKCNISPGDWVAELHIVTRKVDHVDTSSGREVDNQATEEG